MTTCELEVDIVADHILNREEIEARVGNNTGLDAIWREENYRRGLRGLNPLNSLQSSQGKEPTCEFDWLNIVKLN